MSQWTRGPVCGVDNCRSRLYRSSDGMQICQYGHVMEGNVEINDEQDDNFVSTRRLNLQVDGRGFTIALQTALQRDHKDKKEYGANAKNVYLRCLQVLLKNQLASIEGHFDFDREETTSVTKLYWIKLLQASFEQDAKVNLPTALDLVSILYLALLKTAPTPVYVSDVLGAIKSGTIPYMKCLHLIPKSYLEKLPSFYFKSLEPNKLPVSDELYGAILGNIKKMGGGGSEVVETEPEIDIEPMSLDYYYRLIFHVLSQLLVFPNAPRLFLICAGLGSKLGTSFRLTSKTKLVDFPELKVAALIVMTTKVFFTMFNDISFAKWIQVITEKEINAEFPFVGHDPNNNDDDLLDWSPEKIDKYCSWLYDNLVPVENKDESSVMKKRLYQIFDFNNSRTQNSQFALSNTITNGREQVGDSVLLPLNHYLEQIATDNTRTKVNAEDIKLLQDKLYNIMATFFGVHKELLISCYNAVEKDIKASFSST